MVVIQAKDYITGNGNDFAGKSYVVTETWTPIYDSKSKAVKSGTLDDNGHASFEIKMKKNRKYILAIGQPDNICYSDLSFHHLNHESTNNINFEYAPCAYSKLILNNSSCIDENDTLILYQSDNLGEITSSEGWVNTGCFYWESPGGTDNDPIGYSTVPYGNIYYKWIVIKDGVSNTYYDTVFYDKGEFKTYEIEY